MSFYTEGYVNEICKCEFNTQKTTTKIMCLLSFIPPVFRRNRVSTLFIEIVGLHCSGIH